MTKSKLIKLLCEKNLSCKEKPNFNLSEITQIVDLIFETMSKALSEGQRIEIRGFGSFSLRKREGQSNARDPRDGKIISIEERWVPYFRQGKGFFTKINDV